RPGGANAEGRRSIGRVVARATHDGGIAVGGQRNGGALTGTSAGTAADKLLALLRPDTAPAGEHPGRSSLVVVGPPSHDGGVAVGGQCDGGALAGASRSAATNQLVALLGPNTT